MWFSEKAADIEAARGHLGSAKLRIEAFLTLRVLVAKVVLWFILVNKFMIIHTPMHKAQIGSENLQVKYSSMQIEILWSLSLC